MFEPSLACFQRGLWSDRHGITERDPTLAFSIASIDPGDLPQDRPVPEYHPQILACRRCGAEVQCPGTSEQARPVCGSVVGLAEDGIQEGPQAEADDEAVTCRPGQPWL